jgi:ATP-dependent DNA helicase RecG
MKAVIGYRGIQRIERFPVPYDALREAVLNALVHRDYAVPAPIQIRVYEDKLKIWNPAVLPEGWNLEKLLGLHASHPYNPHVANAFFRSGEIESWGRGIERIFSACAQAETPPPSIQLDGHDFWIEFPFSEHYLVTITRETAQERTQKDPGDRNQPDGLVDGLVDRLVDGLVENQREILEILRANPYTSKKEMAKILGISSTAIDKNIETLKKKGLLQRVGSARGGYWKVLH